MSVDCRVLTDVDNDVYVDAIELGPADVPAMPGAFSVGKRTLRGGLRDGVDVVEVDNGRFRFTIVPDRGMGIWRGWLAQLEVGWQSPLKGPVNPRLVPLDEPSGIGWLRGFDEWVCRCGLEYNGAPEWDASGRLVHTLHGRVANLPAHYVDVRLSPATGEIAVTGVVDETRLFGNKLRLRSTVRTRLGEPGFTIEDEISNLSAQPGELELLYHINVGRPLAVPGSKFHAAVETLAPRDAASAAGLAQWRSYPPHELATPETVLFFELATDAVGNTQTLLEAPDGAGGLSLKFNRRQFPYFVLWKSPLMPADGYVTGLEPSINFPHPKGFEKQQGRVAVLESGQSRSFEIGFVVHGTAAEVAASRAAIEELGRGVPPLVFDRPRPGWSP